MILHVHPTIDYLRVPRFVQVTVTHESFLKGRKMRTPEVICTFVYKVQLIYFLAELYKDMSRSYHRHNTLRDDELYLVPLLNFY